MALYCIYALALMGTARMVLDEAQWWEVFVIAGIYVALGALVMAGPA